ncbi:MAG: alpha/beta hydrolase [Gammaproteobacteria bacterium]|nr:alpha/beta hydrolase [Gammaproteobacteria bacterium]
MNRMTHCWLGYCLLFLCFSGAAVHASVTRINIPIEELTRNVDGSGPSAGEPLKQYLIQLLQNEINEAGLQYGAGQIIDTFSTPRTEYDVACSIDKIILKPATVIVELTSGTNFDLQLDGLREVTLTATLNGRLSTLIPTTVKYGIRFFGCKRLGEDNGDIRVRTSFSANVSFAVTLQPEFDSVNNAIVIDKHGELSGTASFFKTDIDPDFGDTRITDVIIEAFERQLKDSLAVNGRQAFNRFLKNTNNKLNGLDERGIPDQSITPFNGETVYVLPDDVAQVEFAIQLIREFDLPDVLFDTLNHNAAEFLFNMLTADKQSREAYLAELGAGVVCDTVRRKFEVDMVRTPLYWFDGANCAQVDINESDKERYFSDSLCQDAVAFRATPTASFCTTQFGPDSKVLLGNSASWQRDELQVNDPLPDVPSQKWTALTGTQLGIGVLPIVSHKQPYTKRVNYKTVENISRGNGTCELEMRIYKSDITASGLLPALAFHGGTWKSRGFSFLGLEASISLLTERGFVVFVPFYRLVGESDANSECNSADWRDVTADVESSLDWVKTNGLAFGASNEAVTVFGQSAGAHLAAWLATERPSDIRKVLTLYPSLDIIDFLQGINVQDGRYLSIRDFGLKVFSRFYGAKNGVSEVDLSKLNLAVLDVTAPPVSLAGHIPDETFNLLGLDSTRLPAYLSRCLTSTATNLSDINLSSPPTVLLQCLKDDLSEFVLSNSFIHKMSARTPPLYIVQGTEDELVPYQQSLVLCASLNNTAPLGDLTGWPILVSLSCGGRHQLQIIQGAEHMLDFGLCVGALCPAGALGSQTRAGVATALTDSFNWLAVQP